jgi:hypothetical protein
VPPALTARTSAMNTASRQQITCERCHSLPQCGIHESPTNGVGERVGPARDAHLRKQGRESGVDLSRMHTKAIGHLVTR